MVARVVRNITADSWYVSGDGSGVADNNDDGRQHSDLAEEGKGGIRVSEALPLSSFTGRSSVKRMSKI